MKCQSKLRSVSLNFYPYKENQRCAQHMDCPGLCSDSSLRVNSCSWSREADPSIAGRLSIGDYKRLLRKGNAYDFFVLEIY